MKIGIYDPYLDDGGGGEKYMMTIAECLSKDNDVDVFWDSKEDLSVSVNRFSLNLSSVQVVPNIFRQSISKRIKASRKYDAIIFLSDGSIPVLFSKKLFIHIQQPLSQFQSASLKDKLKLSRVTAFFCNSEYTKSFITKKFHLKTFVLYPPVELRPKKLKKENIILHVGRFRIYDKTIGISDYKKQHIMVKAFKELVDQGLKKWKFVLCVNVKEEDKAAFEKLVASVKKYPIEFKINKSNDELWEYYSKAKIYWHASGFGEDLEKHPEFAEHFGISTVEAMGAGAVPAVISAGGQKEIVTDGENGLLWNTLPELKEVTLILINSKDLLRDLSENAKKRALDFGKEAFAKKLNDLISA